MPLVSLPFSFTQELPLSVDDAYAWATDYGSGDLAMMGMNGRRKVAHLGNDTILLTDTFTGDDGKKLSKKKLVRLYPSRRMWTNTHVTGPNQHSQFIYELLETPGKKDRCTLRFTGQQILRVDEEWTPAQIRKRAKEVEREDHATWKRIARAMKAAHS